MSKLEDEFKKHRNSDRSRPSRIKKYDRKRWRPDKTSLALLGIVAVCGAGLLSYKSYQHHKDSVQQSAVTRKQTKNAVTCEVLTVPNSRIILNGSECGQANGDGKYVLHDAQAGDTVKTTYGVNKSLPIKLKRSSSDRAVHPQFDYLTGSSAQDIIDSLYTQVMDGINDGHRASLRKINEFYTPESESGHEMMTWARAQQSAVKATTQKADNGKAISSNALTGIYFAVQVRSLKLNKDGTVSVDYQVKDDLAMPEKDKIQTYDWTAVMRKTKRGWLIQHARSGSVPVKTETRG